MPDSGTQAHDHEGLFAGLHSHDGGPPHWHDEFGEHLAEDLTEEELAARRLDWQKHNVQIVTVGLDIGSSTTHLMFSKIFMQLVGEERDIHTVIVGREILAESPIVLTPYLPDDTIDAAALQRLVTETYQAVGATPSDVDSGVVILTGEALKRTNARALAELFADATGKFVRASAGHHLEAVLAANGSGTVSRSRRDGQTILNVDIGGGTTKFALVDAGEILATAAVAIGARLLVLDESRLLTRIDGPARQVAEHLGIELALGQPLSVENEVRIVEIWTDILADLIALRTPTGLAADLMLTEPLPSQPVPRALTFSGGVSEFFFLREARDFGDLGKPLAEGLRRALADKRIRLPVVMDPNLGIRATAVGASLFTVQVGINVYLSDESILPLANVPVLAPRLTLDELTPEGVAAAIRRALERLDIEEGEQPVALSLTLGDEPEPPDVAALANGIRGGLPRTVRDSVPFVVLLDSGGSRALGAALKEDSGIPGNVLVLDRVTVREFDFIDVAPLERPADIVPVTIKSLLFAGGLDRRSVKHALYDAAMSGRTSSRKK